MKGGDSNSERVEATGVYHALRSCPEEELTLRYPTFPTGNWNGCVATTFGRERSYPFGTYSQSIGLRGTGFCAGRTSLFLELAWYSSPAPTTAVHVTRRRRAASLGGGFV